MRVKSDDISHYNTVNALCIDVTPKVMPLFVFEWVPNLARTFIWQIGKLFLSAFGNDFCVVVLLYIAPEFTVETTAKSTCEKFVNSETKEQ
jgi:hypothetical protein